MERELVVARYREDVRWVLDSPIPATIYNAGPPLDLDDHPNVDVIELPGRGREAGVWLEHTCRNYNDLAGWSYFAQGDPHQDPAGFFRRLETRHDDTTPLTSLYKPDHPSPEVKARDRVEWIGGVEVRWGLADPNTPGICDACSSPCEPLWRQYFSGPRPDPWWFGYGAMYSVPRHRITDRPLEYWAWLRDLMARSNQADHVGLSNAWSMELVWGYLWADARAYPVHPVPTAGPSLLRKAANLATTLGTQLLAGNPAASPEVQAIRRAECFACDAHHDHPKDTCNQCGCVKMDWKRSMATASCPVGRWGPIPS